MNYQSLDTTTDVQKCMSTYPSDPVAMWSCIRQAMGYPPISPTNIPTVTSNTITCLRTIFNKYTGQGTVDNAGNVHLPFQTVIAMINEVRACLGLPALNIPGSLTCIMNTCMMGVTPGSIADISSCVKTCVSQYQQ